MVLKKLDKSIDTPPNEWYAIGIERKQNVMKKERKEMKNLKAFVEITVFILTMCAGFIGVCGAEEIGVQYGVYIGYAVLAVSALSWYCTYKMFELMFD